LHGQEVAAGSERFRTYEITMERMECMTEGEFIIDEAHVIAQPSPQSKAYLDRLAREARTIRGRDVVRRGRVAVTGDGYPTEARGAERRR
jgi:hypothetical protein